MSAIFTLAFKDVRLLLRDKGSLFWVLVFPVLIAILFGSIFGNMGGGRGANRMKVAVIDQDRSAGSATFLKKLRASEALTVDTPPESEARESVRKGDRVAFVIVPKGFGETNFFGGQGPALEVGIDPSRKAEAGYLQGLLTEASFAVMTAPFSDPAKMREQLGRSQEQVRSAAGLDPGQKQSLGNLFSALDQLYRGPQPLAAQAGPGGPNFAGPQLKTVPVLPQQEAHPKSSFEISFPQAIVWALFGVVTTFAQSLVRERSAGTLLRLRVAPLSRAQILAGKGVACFLACIGVIALLLLLGRLLFHVRFENPAGLALAILSAGICFVGLMMLLSVIGRTEQSVAASASGVMIILTMFGGGMIPLIAMPPWMLKVSNLSPIKWTAYSLEGAIWRGFSLTELLLPCGILLAVGLVTFLLGERVLAARQD